jgi:hypothetical protein
MEMVVTLALILTFFPGEKEQRARVSGFADTCPANPVAREFQRDGKRFSLPLEESQKGWIDGVFLQP